MAATTLEETLKGAGIKHFKATEVVLPGRGSPSEKQWPNIVGALRVTAPTEIVGA